MCTRSISHSTSSGRYCVKPLSYSTSGGAAKWPSPSISCGSDDWPSSVVVHAARERHHFNESSVSERPASSAICA
eukprot:scaffold106175_cov63-Phaeocystis_antarctica.AAC.1